MAQIEGGSLWFVDAHPFDQVFFFAPTWYAARELARVHYGRDVPNDAEWGFLNDWESFDRHMTVASKPDYPMAVMVVDGPGARFPVRELSSHKMEARHAHACARSIE